MGKKPYSYNQQGPGMVGTQQEKVGWEKHQL